MEPPQRRSRISGARRRRQRPHVLWIACGLVVAVGLVLVLEDGTGPREPAPVFPAPTSEARVVGTPPPSPRPPLPSPSPTLPTVSGSVSVKLVPSPPPSSAPAARARQPDPTAAPAPDSCVRVRSAWARSAPNAAHIVIEVAVENGCNRDLDSLELWVWVGGYRDGRLVQSARGHPFERVRAGRDARVTIGLPGSATWYDRIEARAIPVDGGAR